MKLKYAVWDFNGTILDDSWASLAAVNSMLESRGMDRMDFQKYGSLIETPIIRFYEKTFDLGKIPFETLLEEFEAGYAQNSGLVRLADGINEVIYGLDGMGVRQVILSSLQGRAIEGWLEAFGISRYFESVLGALDNLAGEKTARGLKWARAAGAGSANCVMIGDTLHDLEASRKMGVGCIMAAWGHQDKALLRGCGAPLAASPQNILPLMEKMGLL